jgi:hypothetical protein
VGTAPVDLVGLCPVCPPAVSAGSDCVPVPGLCLFELGLALGAPGGPVAVEQREYLQVFGTAGRLLGADHVIEVGDHDDDVSDTDPVSACGQLGVSGSEAGRMEGDVELAVVADQVPRPLPRPVRRRRGRRAVLQAWFRCGSGRPVR